MPHLSSPFGPLLLWELVRLARRKQASRDRILLLYLLLLTIGLFAVWWSPSNPLHLFRATAEPLPLKLALILLEAQLLFVALLAPAYAAMAVSEEKDRQTLSLLLTTELTDREIVWGKAIARTILMLYSVAAGIPL